MKILAIDPGSMESAFVVWDGCFIIAKGIERNEDLLNKLYGWTGPSLQIVIEQVRSYGMKVGMTVFDTVWWSGRFYEAWSYGMGECHMMPRMDVKLHICHDSRAKDTNIRQALIDRFEPNLQPRQRPKDILKGLKKDLWAAFALAVTFFDEEVKT